MITDTLKQIADAKDKLAALEKKAETERTKALRNLHTEHGFATRADLIAALRELDGKGAKKRSGRRRSKAKKAVKVASAKKAAKKGAKKRAKRAKITPELKADVVKAIKEGGTGTQIAKQFGISVPSLHNIKKEAGLVTPRK